MLPPAPGLFSTTKGWPSASCNRGPIRRASTSLVLPTMGTTMRTGLVGRQSEASVWAQAEAAVQAASATAAASFRCFVMGSLLWLLSWEMGWGLKG